MTFSAIPCRTRNKSYSPLLAGFVIVVISICGCSSNKGAPAAAPPTTQVTASYPLKKQIVEWDSYTGRLEAVDFVEIRARVSGYLEDIYFDEGHEVKQGDLLFQIDPRPFKAELNRAKATLQQAESQLKEAIAQLQEAKAQKLQADAQQTLAKTRVDRVRSLNSQNAVSEEEIDQRQAEFLQAEADVEAAIAKISSSEAAISTAEATISTAEAGVEAAQLNLDYTKVYAPINGLISRQNVSRGNLVSGGSETSTLLTTIASVAPIYCTFDANEQEVLKYTRLAQTGQRASSRFAKNPVYLSVVDEKGFPHLGHMEFVDNRIDSNTASMRARSIFRNEDSVLTPGMFARIRIPGSAAYEAVLIPDASIATDQSDQYVFVIEDGKALRRDVELGPIVHGLRVVRSGVAEDDLIVLEGLLRVRDGMDVAYTEDDEQGLHRIVALEDGLPDYYEPLSQEDWISDGRPVDRSVNLRPQLKTSEPSVRAEVDTPASNSPTEPVSPTAPTTDKPTAPVGEGDSSQQ